MSRRHRVPGTPKTLFVLPSIKDDMPDGLKNTLAIRNACATEGMCPACGAEGTLRPTAVGDVYVWTFEHDDGCDALGMTS